MLRTHLNVKPLKQQLRIAAFITSAALGLLSSFYANAQQTPNTTNTPGGQPNEQAEAADENQETDAGGQPKPSDEQTENPATPAQPLPPPAQYTYTEAVRDPLLGQELGHLRGSLQRIELQGNQQTFSGIWQADLSGEPLGAALIMTPADASPSKLELRNLQYYLALNGWASLTITSLSKTPKPIPPAGPIRLPAPPAADNDSDSDDKSASDEKATDIDESEVVYQEPDPEPAKETENSEGSENTDNDAAPLTEQPSNSELMTERIGLGLNELAKKNFFNNVVIAYGSSATQVAIYLNESAEPDAQSLRAFVLINTQTPANITKPTSANQPSLDTITELQRPTLDIINLPYPMAIDAQTERINRAKQLKHPMYVARKIVLGESNTHTENNLSRIVRGFITRHGAGTETKAGN